MENENIIEVLNSLIIINNDRIEGYKTAEAEAKETDLKMLFGDLMETSVQNRKELVAEVTRLGATPDEGTRVTGKFFRVWMDVKAAFTGSDRKAILDSCEYGEDVILDTYKKILIQDHQEVRPREQDMLNKHYALLKADHDKVKQLRDIIANEKRLQE
ncbi:ferritin-like domain-containing protein [Flavobacterium restrictum]|uniref:PA2169 family four-helix-bundle protein n=1 Tax=Flavobacterium restrictum TaxID=2594428 RepID=A0A553EDL8_9FLAO|nr:PA2169 family four-helix-bundle protein [Flavobacterium restrictum]TRX43147.1 PA2169 family four-helix-bundle protein [Flavobacterium restrictum]